MIKSVEFYNADGKLQRTMVDMKHARLVGVYNRVYKNADKFAVSRDTPQMQENGLMRDTIVAKSDNLTIVCARDYKPNFPKHVPTITTDWYTCSVTKHTNGTKQKTDDMHGTLPELYYKLFDGLTK